MTDSRSYKNIYFVGIGGIGMSALARYFHSLKWAVSGSDAASGPITRSLAKDGIRAKIGHKKGNVKPDTALLVYNRAILPNNPELVEARRLGIPTLPYASVLGGLTNNFLTIAVTGSHGKSTTTALAGITLMKGGYDPTILIGTNLKELGGKNVRIGKSPYLVLEADDFGAAFLEYSPTIAIVTNIDREHMDFYKTFANVKSAFLKFLSKTRQGGVWILNRDDKILFSLRVQIAALGKKLQVRTVWYSVKDTSSAAKIKKALAIPGEHNRSNAAAVYALGKLLNIDERKMLGAFAAYHGAWRRMEYRGMANFTGGRNGAASAKIFDDYAHHPTEIKATLAAFREKFPDSPLVCVFQPHQAKRVEALFGEFKTAFSEADVTIILPLYTVAGRDKKTIKDSAALVRAMQKNSPKKYIFYAESKKRVRPMLNELLPHLKNPVLIMMGAGDIVDITDSLL